MALEFADGFDHYGTGTTGKTNALLGVYAELSPNITFSSSNPFTGVNALGATTTNDAYCRRVLGGLRKTVGLGAHYYFQSLPSFAARFAFLQARDNLNNKIATITLSTTGVIEVRDGSESGTIRAQSASPVIVAGAYQHVECKITPGASSTGSAEVRVNGVTVVTASGVTLGSADVAQIAVGAVSPSGNGIGEFWIDNAVCWSQFGSSPFEAPYDFVGEAICERVNPNADTGISDWTRNAGSFDYDAIDDTAPDADATYIEAAAVDDESEFGLANVSAQAVSIVGVCAYCMARKTDAGDGDLVQRLIETGSPTAEQDGETHNLTTSYAYYVDVFRDNPATGAPWTPAELNAARYGLDRTL